MPGQHERRLLAGGIQPVPVRHRYAAFPWRAAATC
jgi:hypothetical protein